MGFSDFDQPMTNSWVRICWAFNYFNFDFKCTITMYEY